MYSGLSLEQLNDPAFMAQVMSGMDEMMASNPFNVPGMAEAAAAANAAPQNPTAAFPSDGPLRLPKENEATMRRGLLGTKFTFPDGRNAFPSDPQIQARVRNIGIAAAVGLPVAAGLAATYNHFQNQEQEKANALLNHHLRQQ